MRRDILLPILILFLSFCSLSAQAPDTEPVQQQPQPKEEEPVKVRAGYDDGFFIEVVDPQKKGRDFLFKHQNRVQLRHVFFEASNMNPDENDLQIERVRPAFVGHMFWPYFDYNLTLNIGSDGEDLAELYNAYFIFTFSEAFKWKNQLGIQAGLWKTNTFRQEITSDGRQHFVDRSMANEFFNIDRNVGVGLLGKWATGPRPVWWHVTVTNGFDTDGRAASRQGDLDENLAYTGRAYSDLVGEWGTDEEPDLSFHESPAVRAGFGIGFTRVDAEGQSELRLFRVVDSGQRLVDRAPGLTGYDVWLYEFDAGFKYRGLSLTNEFFFRRLTDFEGTTLPRLFDYGYYAQAGYFLIPEKLEVVGRYSSIVGDSETLGGRNEGGQEAGGGFNWYFREHDLKLQFNVLHYNSAPVSSTSAQLRPGDSGWMVLTQFQFGY